ncbi:MAG: hypothetical protein Q9222_004427 [Ikaeria aurantiellina]
MAVNRGNVFSSKNLCEHMLSSLPKDASPQLQNPYDAIALLTHACMLAADFRLEESTSDPSNPSPLPHEWNASSTSNYAFRYAHTQSALHYIIKISRLGPKAIVHGLAIDDDKVHTLEVPIKDFLSPSSFPFTASTASGSPETSSNEQNLTNLFISPGRLTDLASIFKISILQKLAGGLHKEGYEEEGEPQSLSSSAHAASRASHPERQPPERGDPSPLHDPLRDDRLPPMAQPRPFNDPLAAEPRRPYPAGDLPPPGFEDEYEINRAPGRGGLGGERRPLNIGERDLYPPGIGPHDPLRIGPGGVGGGGGGMHPTFDDPMFGGGAGGGMGGYGSRAPPGARYDPVGPGDGPPRDMRGGPRLPGRGGGTGGMPSNPFGGFGGNDFI